MKKYVVYSILFFVILLSPLSAYAAFDGTRPADSELLKDAPALIRANFNALKDMIDQIYVNYAGTDAVALKADKSYVDANFAPTGEVALKANKADVYTTDEINLKFLNHYTTAEIDLKLTSYYTTAEVDSKLSLKLDSSAISSYYNKNEINQLLLDKAGTDAVALKADKSYVDENFSTTGAVALKANSADVFTTQEITLMLDDKADTSSVITISDNLAAHTGEVAAHGRKSPVGQAANVIEVTDGAGGWTLTPIAAASGSVTQAVDLVVNASTFSRIMNAAATNAQAALNQIEANAATTGEVATKANSADVYTKTEADAITEAYVASKNYATKAQVSEEVLVHNVSASAHTTIFGTNGNWKIMSTQLVPANMANGDWTGEVIIDTVAASQTVYNVVYSSNTGWMAAKADADATLPALGMALETGTGDKKILLRGIVKNTTWNFTKGNLIYVSTATAGAITAVKPSASGNRVQPVGVALSADTIFFNPTNVFWEL